MLGYLLAGLLLLGGAGTWWGHHSGYDEGHDTGFHSRDDEVRLLKADAAQATGQLDTCVASNKTLDLRLSGLNDRVTAAEQLCSQAHSRSGLVDQEQAATVSMYKKRAELAEAREAQLRKDSKPASQQCKDVLAAVRNVAEGAGDRIREILGFNGAAAATGPDRLQVR